MIPKGKKPIEWWEQEARKLIGRTCPKCSNPTDGLYVTPNEYGECGVFERCLICGWTYLVLAGKNHVILKQKERSRTVKPIGDKSVDGEWRFGARMVGAPLKSGIGKSGKTHHGGSVLLNEQAIL